jgi:hypothetical protein
MPETSHNQFLDAWKKSLSSDTSTVVSQDTTTDVLGGAPVGRKSGRVPFFKKKGFWIGVAVVVLLLGSVSGVAGFVGFGVYKQAMEVKAEMMEASVTGRAAYTALKAQNLIEGKAQFKETQKNITEAEEKFKALAWTGKLPIASKYYEDGTAGFTAAQAGVRAGIKVIEAVEPHADVLGFSGEGTFTGGTTEDRIGLILKTLGEITPQLDSVAAEMKIVEENLAKIDPADYPEDLRGYKVRELIVQANVVADGANSALTDFRPVLEKLPEVAGAKGRKKYLVLFQNDNELRPTGGFLTAYAVVFVENGKVTPEKSDDIYELDKKFSKKPAIPPELGRFLVSEKKWNLRDMNIDPNFENSMKTFYEYYKQVPGESQNIDGIIAVDTNILERIVNILGPVEVPGYGTFSSQTSAICDCPQIIYALSEIIDRPTPYLRENRKGILAPMMQSILQKTYATERNKWPQLAELLWKGIEGRHVQFYFLNPELQAAAKTINATGEIPQLPTDGSDFLAVVDANLAGAKSNLFVDTTGIQKIKGVENGRLTKEVELTYVNDHAPSNCNLEAGQLCLNGLLNDWTRWYVPKGAQIVDVLGLEPGYKLDTSHAEFDIIEGIFRLAPKSQTKVRITYSVPYTWTKGYKGTLQKQGGVNNIPYSFETPWGEKEVNLEKDTVVTIGQ